MRKILALLACLVCGVAFAFPVKSMLGAYEASRNESDESGWDNPYITDGLIAMWDGEWNAGPMLNDPESPVWKDLVGGIGDMHFFIGGTKTPSPSPMRNDGQFYCADGTNYCAAADANGILSRIVNGEFTIEYVNMSDQLLTLNHNHYGLSHCPETYWRHYDGGAIIYANFGRNCATSKLPRKTGFSGCIVNHQSITEFYNNGILVNSNTSTMFSYHYRYQGDIFDNGYMSLKGFANWVGGVSADCKQVKIGCIRIYSRALTEEEVQYNYLVDKERFGL